MHSSAQKLDFYISGLPLLDSRHLSAYNKLDRYTAKEVYADQTQQCLSR
jgi:hypothetical protein